MVVDMTIEMRKMAERLRADALPKLELADRLFKQAEEQASGKGSRISHEGLEKIRLTSRAQWVECPIACGHIKGGGVIKHRHGHPHLRRRPQMEAKAA